MQRRWIDPSWPEQLFAQLRRHAYAAAFLFVLIGGSYGVNIAYGFHVHARESGVLQLQGLHQPVSIVRDARGIPHIRAQNEHDLFFAQGFAEASDRLFQMDLTRRYAYGTLAEIFGSQALPIDERQRAVDIRGIAQRQWNGSDAPTRDALRAFADGINAAEQTQPLPVEFRMVVYKPKPWTPQDSIAVAVVAALELGDSWHDVMLRDRRWTLLGRRCYDAEYPLSDPRYDVTIDGKPLPENAREPLPDCPHYLFAMLNGVNNLDGRNGSLQRPHLGSNAWAVGAARSADHHALVANDPHVDLTIPGIWYLVDLHAPALHAAGAVVPGLPGVTLGHNERVAWAITNAQVSTNVLYRAHLPKSARIVERFNVRFGSPVTRVYYRTATAFTVPDDSDPTQTIVVRWPTYAQRVSTIASSLALDRSTNIAAATRALRSYRGSPENIVLADISGRIAYRLAGEIPNDTAWGRFVHPAADLMRPLQTIAFEDLPHRDAAANGMLVSANNRMYGAGYPYRLSAEFELPYRAHRIAALLRAHKDATWQQFAAMQLDTYSPVDAEFAHAVARVAQLDPDLRNTNRARALAMWNGRFDPHSRAATLEHHVRTELEQSGRSLPFILRDLRGAPRDLDMDVSSALWPAQSSADPWGDIGRVQVDHPLSPMWYGLLRGASIPGDGDEYTIHLQEPGFAQGFRAVWDVGNWDAGGIVIPSGESGEPGSAHYDDLAQIWIDGRIVALPFSARAVSRESVSQLTLLP